MPYVTVISSDFPMVKCHVQPNYRPFDGPSVRRTSSQVHRLSADPADPWLRPTGWCNSWGPKGVLSVQWVNITIREITGGYGSYNIL